MSRSYTSKQPAIEPALQTRLVEKFGKKILKEGFTAVPVAVQRHYRLVPGNPIYDKDGKLLQGKTIYNEDGEAVEDVSYMTPTEYSIMVDIWSWWWSAEVKPWPSKSQIAQHLQKSERTIQRYLDRLENKGFMLAFYQFNAQGKQISNRYDFSPFLTRLLAYLDSIEPLGELPPTSSRGDKNGSQRETKIARIGETELPPESDETSSDRFDIEGVPNGVAIFPEREAVTAIRKPQGLVTETEETEESSTQHLPPTPQTEDRREEEERPAELQNGQDVPEVQGKTPRLVIQGLIHQYTPILNDHQAMNEEKHMRSNVTRADNLFQKYGVFSQEQIAAIMGRAFIDAKNFPEAKVEAINEDDKSKNRMRFFYYRLEKRIEKYVATSSNNRTTPAPKKRPAANGKPLPVTTPQQAQVTGMSRGDAEALAWEIHQDEKKLQLGIQGVTTMPDAEGKTATVVFTWQKKTVVIHNQQDWQRLKPTFARRSGKGGDEHGTN